MDLAAPATTDPPRAPRPRPRRVLLLTASVGEGHNGAARAITRALDRDAPGCVTRVSDVFEVTGRAVEGERRRYRLGVEVFPFAYQWWYDAVRVSDRCHAYYRDVEGSRVGRALHATIEEFGPDVVVSTYPLATAGLAWLRRTGRLGVPVRAVLSDFAPHRFWVYPGVDEYLVLSEHGRAALADLTPDVPARVCAPAVDAGFRPPDAVRARCARERFGLPAHGMVVLVSAGAMAMGPVRRTIRAVRRAGVHAVITSGRNQGLGRALRRRGTGGVTVIDWTDDMPDLIAACDVVVNNAGGTTAAETLASGRALVMFRPIPGHGRAAAALMERAGVATTRSDSRSLTALLAGWAADPRLLRAAQRRAVRGSGARRPAEIAAAVLGGDAVVRS